jgi:hypothetical protein
VAVLAPERRGHRVTGAVTTVLLWAAVTAAVSASVGCGGGCDTEVALEPVVIRGNGQQRVDLDLSARITAGGRPIKDLVVQFEIGWPASGAGGTALGSATTNADGVARLHAPGYLGPGSAFGENAAEWTRYEAEPALFQPSKEAADRMCMRTGQASFRFEP